MRLKLEEVLNRPGALQSEEIWKAGIEKVWKGLVGGGRLKKRLPMGIVVRRTPYVRQIVVESFQIKIIHAGWLRDPNTWPAAPIADDVLEEGPLLPTVPLTSWSVPDPSPETTTPWAAMSLPQIRTLDEVRPSGVVVPAG